MSGEPPGTGYWTRDRTHFSRPLPALWLGLVADGTSARAYAEGAARIGVCDGGGDVVVRDGWIFRRSRPLDPATFADRERAAREFLENKGGSSSSRSGPRSDGSWRRPVAARSRST